MQATAHFVFWTILLQTLIGFTLAYLIDRKFRGHAFWTTIILVPMMLSPAVVGNFWRFLYRAADRAVRLRRLVLHRHPDRPIIQMLANVSLAPWAIVIVDTWMWTPYVMLICLAGLRSIPDYIYEAAEVDRASNWRQFWSITLPMALPFIMLAVLFRGIENFKMFDMVNLLTGGGPGSTTEVASITLKREAFEKLAHRLFLGLRHHPLRRGVRPRQHLRQGAQQGEAAMSLTTAHSVVEPSTLRKRIAGAIVDRLCADLDRSRCSGSSPPASRRRRIRSPIRRSWSSRRSIEGYCNLFTTRTRQTPEYINSLGPATDFCDEVTRKRNMVIAGPSNFLPRFVNSLIIAFGSTFCAVFLGTLAAYGFSRFKVPLADDLLFFILSTRLMPPIAVAIPIYLMYRELGLSDTALGMILLYTAVNVSLAVWLLKGFIDEIPREYEEAAMIDGYTRLQAFRKVVLPQATTGIAATAIFCLIFAWNEYAFAALLPRARRRRRRPSSRPSSAKAARTGRRSLQERRCSWCRSWSSRSCCASSSCAASPSERCANEHGNDTETPSPTGPSGCAAGPMENIATAIIGIGFLMLFQPFALALYTYSFVTMLAGTVMFIIVSKFPE